MLLSSSTSASMSFSETAGKNRPQARQICNFGANDAIWLAELYRSIVQKTCWALKIPLDWMNLLRCFTYCVIFVWIGYPRWPPPWVIVQQKISWGNKWMKSFSYKLQRWLRPNHLWMIFGWWSNDHSCTVGGFMWIINPRWEPQQDKF